ncbi:UDP-glucose 4-epimerase [Desulfitispora alkaliphila]|uniref:UDP-glucose 4-epimerase GalE n=1 Tax=Desulfitispora alkaliphila TaxID=622674 RepID=UPI003D1BE1C5
MILVTGGAGYIGSHTVKTLVDQGYKVVVIDNLSTGHKAAVDKRAVFIQGDIKDEQIVEYIFSDFDIKCVIHFAANCYVGESVINPIKYYENNVAASICLLKLMLQHKVDKLVFSSSCAVYGNPQVEQIDETCSTNPINPYGKTKLIVEQIIRDLSHAYQLKFILLRYFNVAGADPSGAIGEHHNPETHLIPNILLHLLEKKDRIAVYGDDYPTKDGTCIRDFIHVNDLVEAHVLALQSLINNNHSNECYNVGNQQGYSVNEVIKTCERVTGKEVNAEYKARREGDPPMLISTSEKIQSHLGWRPKHSLKDIVETAWKWHWHNTLNV